MVSSVTSTSSSTVNTASSNKKTETTPVNPEQLKAANAVLKSLLTSSEVLESLVTRTTKYVPPSYSMIASTIWGLLDTSGAGVITKEDVQRAVFAVGEGSTSDIDALWAQLNPKKAATISPGDFAKSEYLTENITAMKDEMVEGLEEARAEKQRTSGGSGSMLDFVSGANGSILDFFA